MRILVVEDDKTLQTIIARTLKREKYVVDTADTGTEAIYKGKTNEYALILLDIKLPEKNGFEVCRELRRSRKNTPILMITAVSEEFGATTGLDLGADDYLRKPFDLSELLARIRALLRRQSKDKSPLITYDRIIFDPISHRVFDKSNKEIQLNPKEYRLLQYIILHQGKVITATELIENVWNENLSEIKSNTLEVYICRLRKTLNDFGVKDKLVNIRGYGYKLLTDKDHA